ncbi:carboxypeptidase-like regulatory domain-containing protein [Flavobacterium sp.]|uniref:carboxypeptidase-like regulatory domain-containing protein n=1 Tax=Flavobacterium sp. TaxID=239 RepID=UPI004033A59A
MKYFFTLLLFLFCLQTHAQTISGYVYDEPENKPLEGAWVYLDGTTLSATTDARGFFTMSAPQKYNAALVVSFIGFETMRVEDPFSYGKPFKVLLREESTRLDEVIVNKKKGPFSRKQLLRAFREEFLGRSKAGSSCTIENENDITLWYDVDNNTLNAVAARPIRITNPRLGYKVVFELAVFNVKYRIRSLSEIDAYSTHFSGTTFYTDVTEKKDKEKAEKRRKEAYLGSPTHLVKTLVDGDWGKQKFGFYVGSFPDDPHDYFVVTDTLGLRKVRLLKAPPEDVRPITVFTVRPGSSKGKYDGVSFNILYDKKEQSSISFSTGTFYVDPNGLFFPLNEITFGGYMATLKAGDLLPVDYIYVESP